MTGTTSVCTEDGVWIVVDIATNTAATGQTLADALAELRRRLSHIAEHAA